MEKLVFGSSLLLRLLFDWSQWLDCNQKSFGDNEGEEAAF